MKTMKFSMKALMAMLLFCLPLAMTSCGSDDDGDDNGPKTYTYTWEIKNIEVNPSDPNAGQITSAVQTIISKVWTKFRTLSGYQTDSEKNDTKKEFKIKSTLSETACDQLVFNKWGEVRVDLLTNPSAYSVLPDNSYIEIKRGGTTIVNRDKSGSLK